MFENETTIAWQAMPRHAPVVDAQGEEIGAVTEVLGDLDEDIFHGVAVRLKHDGDTVELPAAHVTRVTTAHVITDLTPDAARALPRYGRA